MLPSFKEDATTHPDPAGEKPAPRQGMPRWVIGFLVGGAIVAAIVVVLLALGHGPGQHMSAPASTPALR